MLKNIEKMHFFFKMMPFNRKNGQKNSILQHFYVKLFAFFA
jgi:hypothetical protein